MRIGIPLGCKNTHVKSCIGCLFIRASLNTVIYGHGVRTLKICVCPRAGTVTSHILVWNNSTKIEYIKQWILMKKNICLRSTVSQKKEISGMLSVRLDFQTGEAVHLRNIWKIWSLFYPIPNPQLNISYIQRLVSNIDHNVFSVHCKLKL